MKTQLYTWLMLMAVLTAAPAGAYTPDDCIACHGEDSTRSVYQMSVDQLQASIHGDLLTCTDCHVHIVDESHQKLSGIGRVDCTYCHGVENRHGIESQGNRPHCHDCHGRHSILPPGDPESTVHPDHRSATCSPCHPAEAGRRDYLSWFPSLRIVSHGKQDLSRDYSRGNCLGCHQGLAVHGEKVRVSGDDCHTCHRQETLMGLIHPRADRQTQPGIFAAAVIYQVVFGILLVGGIAFLLHISGLRPQKKR